VTVQLVLEVILNVPVLFAAGPIFTVAGDTESVDPPEQRLLAAEPVPVGKVEDVERFILSSHAPSYRNANVSV
jgi:hypothetical protein